MKKLTPHIKNLISELEKLGITFRFDDEITKSKRLENIIFEKGDIQYKIYEGYFFRDFGQCVYFKKGKDAIFLVDYTDEIFYADEKMRILKYFFGPLNK